MIVSKKDLSCLVVRMGALPDAVFVDIDSTVEEEVEI